MLTPRLLRVRRSVGHRRGIVATTAPDLLALAERIDALAAERSGRAGIISDGGRTPRLASARSPRRDTCSLAREASTPRCSSC